MNKMKNVALAEAVGISKLKCALISEMVHAIHKGRDKDAYNAMDVYHTFFGKMNDVETAFTFALMAELVEQELANKNK